jgi:cell division protein FtsB
MCRTNKQEITKLEAEIKDLKAEYADMIVKPIAWEQ